MRNNFLKIFTLIFVLTSCNSNDNIENGNNLKKESSPYLLQHAENPVNWNPWNQKYLDLAEKENKLVIISVGYASCHWCHVMERESFQDSTVAELMNDKFISIKVDREERPDIDQVYMNAIQLITGSGGWPLNVITLPDGRPIWGGTYFSKEQWLSALTQISEIYEKEPEKFLLYAERVQEGINSLNIIDSKTNNFESVDLNKYAEKLLGNIDNKFGGFRGAPKFMMPNNLDFLLRYSIQAGNDFSKNQILNSLNMMAYGGIFDHIDGGFSRYSTDGGFYSSLDADSKLDDGTYIEGEYYTWEKSELKDLIKNDFALFSDYYNLNDYGYWEEEEKYILIKNTSDNDFISAHELTKDEFIKKKNKWTLILKKARTNKNKPSLDYKIITSWNGLMISGYVDAYKAFNDEIFKNEAIDAREFIFKKLIKRDNGLYHNYVNGASKINGYLEDYATVIQASLDLYEITLEQIWLERALELSEYVTENFSDEESKLFFFTSKKDEDLISRSIEFRDNVIPSSNSIMAKNLFRLYHYFDKEEYFKRVKDMCLAVSSEFETYPSGYSNWFDLIYNIKSNYYEIAVVGDNAINQTNKLNSKYIPNKLIIGSKSENNLPLLKNRYVKGKTLIYVCVNKACKMPTESLTEAISMISF